MGRTLLPLLLPQPGLMQAAAAATLPPVGGLLEAMDEAVPRAAVGVAGGVACRLAAEGYDAILRKGKG